MCVPNSCFTPPVRGKEGESRFGFMAGDRVEVVRDSHFLGWHGHVRAFRDASVAVDLDEPPAGQPENGNFFAPDQLKQAPLKLRIIDIGGKSHSWFSLQRRPSLSQKLFLETADGRDYNGVCMVVGIKTPSDDSRFDADVSVLYIDTLPRDTPAIPVTYIL